MSNPYRPVSKTKRFFKRIEKFFSICKQKLIVAYLMNHCGGKEIVGNYNRMDKALNNNPITSEAPIWTCWWQGEDNMPEIVKACYNSMRKHSNNHPVILITEKNYQEYIDIPDYIIRKNKEGHIDLTHFSDILRAMLLSKHGGIWMDSTLLLPYKNIDEFIPTNQTFWSCHHKPIYNNISQGGWVSFFWACGKGNFLASFIADMHLAYWSRKDKLVDYLLLDYTFAIARRYIPVVHNMIEDVKMTEMGPLGKYLNEEYTENEWTEFCSRYNFHKVTYKIPLQAKTAQGKKTMYGHIIDTFLNKNES